MSPSLEMEGPRSKPRPDLPVDRGWAWLVMLGSTINCVSGFAFVRSLSIFFPEFLIKFEESATMTTLAFGLNTAAYSVFAILVPPLFLSRYSVRTVTLIGAFVNAGSIIALAFAPSMVYVYVAFVAIGAAHPMIFVSQVTLLGVYFRKRLSFAVSFSNIGVSLATMCSPPLTRYLLDEYGLQGALLIQGGINLHIIAACLLFRPPTCYTTNKTVDNYEKNYIIVEETQDTEELENDNDFEVNPLIIVKETKDKNRDVEVDQANPRMDARKSKSLHDIHSTKSKTGSGIVDTNGSKCELNAKRIISRSHYSLTHQSMSNPLSKSVDVSKSSVFMDGNGITFLAFNDRQSQCETRDSEFETASNNAALEKKTKQCDGSRPPSNASSTKPGCLPSSSSWVRCNLKQHVCCHPLGVMLLLMSGLGIHTLCGAAYMPSLGKEQGLTDRQASLLMTVVGACDLCKLGYGYVADKGWVRRIYIVLVSELIVGLMFQFTSYFQGFVAMVIFCAVFGVNTEVIHCLLPGITVDLLGAEFIGQVMSVYFVLNGLVMSLSHVLIGVFKDETGSFIAGYQLMGGLMLFTAVVILLEPAFKSCVPRDLQSKECPDDSEEGRENKTKC